MKNSIKKAISKLPDCLYGVNIGELAKLDSVCILRVSCKYIEYIIPMTGVRENVMLNSHGYER